jgi:hypothetical protein
MYTVQHEPRREYVFRISTRYPRASTPRISPTTYVPLPSIFSALAKIQSAAEEVEGSSVACSGVVACVIGIDHVLHVFVARWWLCDEGCLRAA